jgi:hypothetical protein
MKRSGKLKGGNRKAAPVVKEAVGTLKETRPTLKEAREAVYGVERAAALKGDLVAGWIPGTGEPVRTVIENPADFRVREKWAKENPVKGSRVADQVDLEA